MWHSIFNHSARLRNSLLGILAFLTITAGYPILAEESDQDIPPMPKGYANETFLKAAFLLGQIKAIDKNPPIPDDVIEEKNIEYGKVGERSLQLDLYRPKNMGKPVPGIIFIHGGGWKDGSREIMKVYAIPFAQRGYVTTTISYRLSKEALFPAAVQDTKCAVRWMRANASKYNIHADRIGISGNSAGAHLALMAGYSSDVLELEGDGGHADVSSRVQAVVDFYGPVDMTTDFAKSQGVVKSFLGKTYEEDPKLYAYASPITHLTRDDPPTLILHGTIDSTVPIDQADTLAKKLQEIGIQYIYEKYDGWPHTMDLAEAVNRRCQYQMNDFFAKYLPLPEK